MKNKLPKTLYVQRITDSNEPYLDVQVDIEEVARIDRDFQTTKQVGIYELKETRQIVQGKPELVKVKP